MVDAIFLTLEEVLIIHEDQIDRYGGSSGIRDVKLLESAVYRPQAVFGGVDLYILVVDKAAALIHSLLLNHPFLDGNKRTAMVAGMVFLELNGYSLVISQKILVEIALSISSKQMSLEEISTWLKKHSQKE